MAPLNMETSDIQILTQNHCQHPESHLEGIEEGDDAKDDDGRESIVGLVIDEVADNSISELVHILIFRNLKPEMGKFSFA